MGDKKNKGTYVVKAGDNLSKIAKDIYGNDRMFAEIQRNNPWYNGILRPGQVLKLPGKRSNPFVSNTEAAAAGMMGGTAETGYGFSGPRAGELNALSAGVRDTGRQINPNTSYGFNQATNVAKQYYGAAGSAVGGAANPFAPKPLNDSRTSQEAAQWQAQHGYGATPAPAPKPVAGTVTAGATVPTQYPGAAATGIGPRPTAAPAKPQYLPGRGGMNVPGHETTPPPDFSGVGNAISGFMNNNPLTNAWRDATRPAGQVTTPAQPATSPKAPFSPPLGGATGGMGWGSPIQGSHFDYQTAGALITSIVAGAGPSVVSAKDLYGFSNGAGLDPTAVAQDMMAKGYRFDPASRSMYKPDSSLASLGIPSLTLGPGVPSEFAGLPPVTPPSGYGPPRPVYTNSGRQESGLSLPPMAEVGNMNASWNIGP